MQLNIRDLSAKGATIHFTDSFDLADLLKGRHDIVEFGTLAADFTAEPESGVTRVTGELTLPVEMLCSRCLTPIKEKLSIPFDESFTQRSELVPKNESEEEVHLVSEDKLDLGPYVEEAVWLALPYVPLCKETCEGICPQCGRNRNEETCDCKLEQIDPRLAGLADLFNKETE
jgi:uncharacterized protein